MLFLDTSALVKRYVLEAGTDLVADIMTSDPEWVASAVAETEATVTLCHAGLSVAGERRQLELLLRDWARFHVVPLDRECLAAAAVIGCEQRIRTLDAIHLAAARRLPSTARFVTFDRRQADAASAIGLEVVPVER